MWVTPANFWMLLHGLKVQPLVPDFWEYSTLRNMNYGPLSTWGYRCIYNFILVWISTQSHLIFIFFKVYRPFKKMQLDVDVSPPPYIITIHSYHL